MARFFERPPVTVKSLHTLFKQNEPVSHYRFQITLISKRKNSETWKFYYTNTLSEAKKFIAAQTCEWRLGEWNDSTLIHERIGRG